MSISDDDFNADLIRHLQWEQEAYKHLKSVMADLAEAARHFWNMGDGYGGAVREMLETAFDAADLPRRDRSSSSSSRKSIPSRLSRSVYERDEYRCVGCGTHKDLQLDHVIPFSKGGPTTFENLQVMCGPCNQSKGAKV